MFFNILKKTLKINLSNIFTYWKYQGNPLTWIQFLCNNGRHFTLVSKNDWKPVLPPQQLPFSWTIISLGVIFKHSFNFFKIPLVVSISILQILVKCLFCLWVLLADLVRVINETLMIFGLTLPHCNSIQKFLQNMPVHDIEKVGSGRFLTNA